MTKAFNAWWHSEIEANEEKNPFAVGNSAFWAFEAWQASLSRSAQECEQLAKQTKEWGGDPAPYYYAAASIRKLME